MEYIGGQVITQSKAVEKQIFNAIASALGKQRFDLWFGHETSVQIENNKIIFSVQEHVVNWIRSSLQTEIEQACESVLKKKSIVEFIVAAENSTVRDNSTLLPNNRADKINQPFLPNPQPTREIYEIHFDSNAIETPTNSTLPIATENAATAPNKFDLNSNQNIIKQQNSRHSKFSNAIIHDTKNSNSNNSNNSINGNINININNTKNTNDNNIDLKPPTGFIQSRSGAQSRYVKSPITSSTSPIANIPRATTRKFASLETFVEGLSNRLAIRGIDFALNHSCLINPIYIYGSSGVGKTHLLEGL
ncbi:MAG: hypothetical protein LBB88_03510, partial [Planctomycetaceae bacterium]|nr:hypothetical protein [Planctomycetaceae bacterium]